MRFSIVSYHLPEEQGTAAGRLLLAACTGLLAEGHDVGVWSWRPDPPRGELPPWCRWASVPSRHGVAGRARALVAARADVVAAGWRPPEDAVAMADDYLSFPAVRPSPRSVLLLHYLTAIDVRALGRRTRAQVQDDRAERAAARRAAAVLAYSPRVAGSCLVPARFVPAAVTVPAEPVAPVEEPVAAVAADWRWPPNRWALDRLLRAWPGARAAVTGSRLLLAGDGLDPVGHLAGVENLGRVDAVDDLLRQAAVVPFPCPPTSGPKVKVLEAFAYGLPVVTTVAGVEGIIRDAGAGAILCDPATFGPTLAGVLADGAGRTAVGAGGRASVLAAHAPAPAARARVAAVEAALGESQR